MFYFQVVLSLGKGPAVTAANDEKKELPDYLPEDEENVTPSNMVRRNCLKHQKICLFQQHQVTKGDLIQSILTGSANPASISNL